jgi:hypothetical protein
MKRLENAMPTLGKIGYECVHVCVSVCAKTRMAAQAKLYIIEHEFI